MQHMTDSGYLLSSPTGPAEQPLGGSLDMSCNSYKQQVDWQHVQKVTTKLHYWGMHLFQFHSATVNLNFTRN